MSANADCAGKRGEALVQMQWRDRPIIGFFGNGQKLVTGGQHGALGRDRSERVLKATQNSANGDERRPRDLEKKTC